MSCWLDTDDELEIIDSTSVEMNLLKRKKPEEQEDRKMSWVVEVDDKLEMMGNASSSSSPKKHSIYRVPPFIARQNKKVYSPQTVSFGPYHHGKVDLKPMEYHKERSLLHFLQRTKVPLKIIFDSFAQVEKELKDSYDSLDSKWQTDNEGFLKLMIVDGCFMLEIFRAVTKTPADYDADDPIFGNHGKVYMMPFIKRDMLVLENQLPMLVLDKLLDISGKKEDEESVNNLILNFCCSKTPVKYSPKWGQCLHVLDIFRKCRLGKDPGTGSGSDRKYGSTKPRKVNATLITRSATELLEAGVRFENKESDSLNGISFKKGVLTLPSFVIDDTTESTFLNMIAFERCHVGAGNEVTSFIWFMDNLIDTAADVSLLQSKNIVHNFIGSDKGAANLFNTISKELTIDQESGLGSVHSQVKEYCEQKWHRWRANLCHTYFTNPWTLISVIAAGVLFGLTGTQTAFSALQYYQSPSPTPSPIPGQHH
ncbi:unnamed protein product [Ilex paraguariensis]|uniref:Uncharacterized protein n=1 Tax=Ilex paraguariensis TaxID=185542 RepID=A0ABC8STM3_9AQUA